MRTTLLFLLTGFFSVLSAQPTIEGDTMLCPDTSGTASITNNQVYDTYQWYWRYWFTSDPFVAIPGADGPSFTYDWLTYDQAQLKVVVTLDGETFESNVIQIDSYAWVGLTVGFENTDNVSINPENGNVMLCAGTGFTIQTYMPYTLVQWYKDGIEISGANQMELHVTEPGSYYVVAAPEFCPDATSSTQGLPIIVEIDNDCNLGLDDPRLQLLSFYPNPVNGQLHFDSRAAIQELTVYDITGKKVWSDRFNTISGIADLTRLASGMYVLEASAAGLTQRYKIIKN